MLCSSTFIRRKCSAVLCCNTDLQKPMLTFPMVKGDENFLTSLIRCEILHRIKCRDGQGFFPILFHVIVSFCSCREWVKHVGNLNLVNEDPRKLHLKYFLCVDHFEKDDIIKSLSGLKSNGVPRYINSSPLSAAVMQAYDLKWSIPVSMLQNDTRVCCEKLSWSWFVSASQGISMSFEETQTSEDNATRPNNATESETVDMHKMQSGNVSSVHWAESLT